MLLSLARIAVLLIDPPPPKPTETDLGVIREARRRRRRRLSLTAALTVAVAGATWLALGAGGPGESAAIGRSRPPEPLPRLSGPALEGPTHLRLVVAGRPPFVLDVDTTTIHSVGGVGLPAVRPTLWSPMLESLSRTPGGALGLVSHQACRHCARSVSAFLIAADGTARHLATIQLRGDDAVAPALGSAAVWLLARLPTGSCTLTLVPGANPGVPVPCGSLVGETRSGVLISTARDAYIVDPRSGRVRVRVAVSPHVAVYNLDGSLALENADPRAGGPIGLHFGHLSLVNLGTGRRRVLVWPSAFGNIIRVVPEPGGPLVAVDFGSPAYPGPAQAEDVWILNTANGRFTHVPGYPAQVDIKFSDVVWTADRRLVIVAQGGGRSVIGVWRPGASTLPLRAVPARAGYSTLVALGG